FDDAHYARKVAQRVGSPTLAESGWHVYSHMTQVGGHRTPVEGWSAPARFAAPGDLPNTDDLLRRSLNISIGVVDAGLGAAFGIN
ncbi:hypothetical protein ACQ1ZK_19825, partial [Enterococcus faecium]